MLVSRNVTGFFIGSFFHRVLQHHVFSQIFHGKFTDFYSIVDLHNGEQWCRSGDTTRLPPMWRGWGPRLGIMCGLSLWVLFSALRGFPLVVRFSPLLKNLYLITFDLC